MALVTAPALPDFADQARRYPVVPVWTDLAGADPLEQVHRRGRAGQGAVLLERSGHDQGRYAVIGLDPVTTLVARGGVVTWTDGPIDGVEPGASLVETLRAVTAARRSPAIPDTPVTAGAIGVLGGDALRPPPATGAPPDSPPEAVLTFPGTMVVCDPDRGRLRLVVHVPVSPERPAEDLYAGARQRLRALVDRLGPVDQPGPEPVAAPGPAPVEMTSDIPDPQFQPMIEAAHRRVRAGEVRQVNISRRFFAPAADPLAVYRTLRASNPAPYLFLLRLPGVTLVGASPQSLIQVRDGEVHTYVIAGTRPRGADPQADAALAAELREDPKERAEHAMLVELAIADLTPVARPGSVTVKDRERLVRYSRVMHLTSEVTGALAQGRTAVDALAAVFPPGGITGVPRAAALRVIDEIEPVPRGLYGGAIGYLGFAGDLDLCLGIRTLQFPDGSGSAYVQAAAGVVADSVPELEVAESRAKASALVAALAQAARAREPA